MSRLAAQLLKCSHVIVRWHLTSCFLRGIYFFRVQYLEEEQEEKFCFFYEAVFSLHFLNFLTLSS